ncbi:MULTISPECIES: endonuclease domain-containing protein [unclassified Microbacterium]|uniref:endonuclease domain-containing protein n=1 Tax=unclassified Microbacterium TaxID=2609290 RepID=UPI003018627C
MPDGVGDEVHLHFPPGSTGPRAPWDGVAHWTRPVGPLGRSLVATIEDALAHVAVCQPPAVALVLWEAAARAEHLAPGALRAIRWPSRAAADLAAEVTGLADSGLEVLVCRPLRRLCVRVRQQAVVAGKRVDVLVGEWLVVQIDGWAHHSSSAQRSKDIAHDAELRLRGYTVLRFSYAQVVHDAVGVERTIRRALAAGLHAAPTR